MWKLGITQSYVNAWQISWWKWGAKPLSHMYTTFRQLETSKWIKTVVQTLVCQASVLVTCVCLPKWRFCCFNSHLCSAKSQWFLLKAPIVSRIHTLIESATPPFHVSRFSPFLLVKSRNSLGEFILSDGDYAGQTHQKTAPSGKVVGLGRRGWSRRPWESWKVGKFTRKRNGKVGFKLEVLWNCLGLREMISNIWMFQ